MIRPGSSISRAKVTNNLQSVMIARKKKKKALPKWQDFVKERDWEGSIAFLELEMSVNNIDNKMWLAYCHFHIGDYRKAINIYDNLMKRPSYNKNLHVFKACCHYALTNYEESRREAAKGDESSLQIRLLYHIAQKKDDENAVMNYHYKLLDNTYDQLCLAGIHYLRGHYEDAIDIYKQIMIKEKDHQAAAAHVYCALCYYKQEYFDVSAEMLQNYLRDYPDSVVAVNLKACTQFQLFEGRAAEEEFKKIEKMYDGGDIYADYDLLRHNLCVFRHGENALQVLPPLVDLFPEARLNLVIYYLRNDSVEEAYRYIKDLKPFSPREYMLRAVVMALLGQKKKNREYVDQAQQDFQLVGTSPLECDTIPGRQCVASFLFLKKQFENVLIYLKTIKEYLGKDDDFNWNYGLACAKVGMWAESEEALASVENENYRNEYIYLSWMARAHVMNEHPELAWKIYMEMDTSNDAITLLKQVANDCYRKGFFFYALKCFDILSRLDTDLDNQHQIAKLGAAVGVFQMMVVRKATRDHFDEMMNILENMPGDPEVEHILRVMRKWIQENAYDM